MLACLAGDGDERDDLGRHLLFDRFHGELYARADLGGLQLRDARWRIWLCVAHLDGGCFFAPNSIGAALDWRGANLLGSVAGGANETADNRSGKRGGGLMRVILALAVLILGSTGGEIAITHGMKATGEPARLPPHPLLQFLGRAVLNGWFWAGVAVVALSIYLLPV